MSNEDLQRAVKLSEKLKRTSQYSDVAKGKLQILRYRDNFFKIDEMRDRIGLDNSEHSEMKAIVEEFEFNMSLFLENVKLNVVEKIKQLK